MDIFHECDLDGSGHMDRDEFSQMLANKKMKRLMRILEIDDTGEEMMELFDLVDIDGSGELSLEEYKGVFFKIMRPPASKDLLRILGMLARTEQKMDALMGLNQSKSSRGSLGHDGQSAHCWKQEWQEIRASQQYAVRTPVHENTDSETPASACQNGQTTGNAAGGQTPQLSEISEALALSRKDVMRLHERFD